MTPPSRLPGGGRLLDRDRPLNVEFDGRRLAGYAGDTLASLLVANAVRICAHGIHTDRPRGLMSAGAEEPNVFVQVTSGSGEPLVRATEIEAYDGLVAHSLRGKGRLPDHSDHARYDKSAAHTEVLVVGGGHAGVRAATKAAAEGGRVLLVHEGPTLTEGADDLAGLDNVTVLTRTTVTGLHDNGYVVAVERRTDHLVDPPAHVARRRLWNIRAGSIVLATGAHERPIAFEGNDLPGVMLAASAARYVTDWAALPGSRAVVFACHDGAVDAALTLAAGGVRVGCVVDVRDSLADGLGRRLAEAQIELRTSSQVVGTRSDDQGRLSAVRLTDRQGVPRWLGCDLLAVSGGWNPALQLYTHTGGRTVWSDDVSAFVPSTGPAHVSVVGAAAGEGLADLHPATVFLAAGSDVHDQLVFLDLQRDAVLADLRRSVTAGLRSPEHVKRYTTISTAADQGRTSSILSVGVLAQTLATSMAEVSPTTYRPPYTPISFAVLAGRDRGHLADPERVSPIHDRHVAAGAVFEDVGQWKRPRYFPRAGESMHEAVRRECAAARSSVAMMDASTLGKIEMQGRDVGVFLDRIYTNLMSTLTVGKVRYGVMCGVDGMVLDDGTVARLSDDCWVATTTTGNAAAVLDWMDEWLQTEWPHLDVRCTSVTEQWATIAVAGPRSRDVVGSLLPDLDVSNEAFGFMQWWAASLAGVPVRVMRISFSGELAYELNVSGWYGQALWEATAEVGAPYDITPYGTETMHVLRAEKGYPIVGQDTDGTVTPQDLGMGWIVSKKKADFVGKRSHAREGATGPGRRQLVGLVPVDGVSQISEGSQLVGVDADLESVPVPMLGHVTSAYDSVALGTPFALALLDDGSTCHGHELQAVDARQPTRVRVVGTVPYDPDGVRRDG